MSESKNEFNPDWLHGITIGDHLSEYMECYNLTVVDLAAYADTSVGYMNNLLNDKAFLTEKVAKSFEELFSRPVHFWFALEKMNHVCETCAHHGYYDMQGGAPECQSCYDFSNWMSGK